MSLIGTLGKALFIAELAAASPVLAEPVQALNEGSHVLMIGEIEECTGEVLARIDELLRSFERTAQEVASDPTTGRACVENGCSLENEETTVDCDDSRAMCFIQREDPGSITACLAVGENKIVALMDSLYPRQHFSEGITLSTEAQMFDITVVGIAEDDGPIKLCKVLGKKGVELTDKVKGAFARVKGLVTGGHAFGKIN